MRYFITLLILFGCLDGYSQKVAVRLNALPATDGAFGAGVSYGIGNKSTVEPEAYGHGSEAKCT
jgi:hypothetical protein